MTMAQSVHIVGLFIAPRHAYYGHAPDAPGNAAMRSLQEVECVAGRGLRGDRFFDWKEDYKGQVTFFAWEDLEAVRDQLRCAGIPAHATRRNVLTRGVDLQSLIGRPFQLGDVRFMGVEECAPCHWMDRAIGPGARQLLRGRGGLRARVAGSGVLRLGPAALVI